MGQDDAYAHGIVENVYAVVRIVIAPWLQHHKWRGSADAIQDSVNELLPLKLHMLQKINV
jgi:hypothetical protein